jgi:hypothetical protein
MEISKASPLAVAARSAGVSPTSIYFHQEEDDAQVDLLQMWLQGRGALPTASLPGL